MIIGIGVGCAIAGAIFAAALAFIFTTKRRRKQRRRQGGGVGLIDLSSGGEADDERDVETSSFPPEKSSFGGREVAGYTKGHLYSELPAPRKLQEMPNPRNDIIELSDTSKVEIADNEKKKITPVEVV